MADNTKIEWTDATWNPIRARLRLKPEVVGWHCEHASPGCANCYSETRNLSGRCNLGTQLPFKPGHQQDVEIFLDERTLLQPLRWKRPRQIFVCSMTDLFASFVTDEMLDSVFAVAALCPQHILQVLTKRSDRMREYLTAPLTAQRIARVMLDNYRDWGVPALPTLLDALANRASEDSPSIAAIPLPNVWLGVSVEDQPRAVQRIPDLLATPAAVRWISCEPLLGQLDIRHALLGQSALNWIVAGGESGPNARPMHPDWARSLRDQCAAAGVPFFFKQWGDWAPIGRLHDDDGDTDETIAAENAFLSAKGRQFEDGDWWTDPADCRIVDGSMYNWANEPAQHPADCIVIKRLGKKRAGRLLDGQLHDAMPQIGGAQ